MANQTTGQTSAQICEYFAELDDPRHEMNRVHKLIDILTIAICAIVCGADDWVTVALFGQAKAHWFARFLALPSGIPAHDTFWRVFRLLDSEQFEHCFVRWIHAISDLTQGQVVAIDGKQLRRSHDRAADQAAIHLVSAWATANGLVLGQQQVEDKSNEITAIPHLLQVLDLAGYLVTVDAMGTQTEIAQQILDQEADYLLALKENHPLLYANTELLFSHLELLPHSLVQPRYARQVTKGHGRLEVRQAWVMSDPRVIRDLRGSEKWPQLAALVKLQADRYYEKSPGEQTHETQLRYYLASCPLTPSQAIAATRAHWQIENALHWVLDIAFREDECRIRKDHGAHNFAILRRLALNLLKQDTTTKAGIKARRLKAGWDHDYLLSLLQPLLIL
jgi:predicted transposase YbfD/YdcC